MIGPLRTMNAPHRTTLPTTMRRGEFWIVPEETEGGARGASHVRWGAPAELTSLVPVVLVHGGGGQSLDWSLTPDGRPGWAHMLIDAGHPVYLPDRPGHGRSAYDRAVHGDILARATPDDLQAVFAPGEDDPRFSAHTGWPWPRTLGHPEFNRLVAGTQPVLADIARSNHLDGKMLSTLLREVGPAIVITHSAGAPAGWLAAEQVPELVATLVAIEPIGPPGADLGVRGRLSFGLTASRPATVDESICTVDIDRPPVLHGLARVPVAVVSADASGRDESCQNTAAFLKRSGVDAEHIRLSDHGISGAGHGLIYERDHHRSLSVILRWIGQTLEMAQLPRP